MQDLNCIEQTYPELRESPWIVTPLLEGGRTGTPQEVARLNFAELTGQILDGKIKGYRVNRKGDE